MISLKIEIIIVVEIKYEWVSVSILIVDIWWGQTINPNNAIVNIV